MSRPWRIGEAMPRREDSALLRGEATFFSSGRSGVDASMAVVRSPVPHGRVDAIDIEAAKALPGVLLILTAADLPRCGALPSVDLVPESLPAPQTVLANGVVRYVGEPVAAVIAEGVVAAETAARAVRLFIAPLPAVTSLDAALDPAAPALHGGPSNAVHTLTHRVGDPDSAFAAAALVIEESFNFHRVCACPMEARGAEARFDAATGTLVVTATTQVPGAARDALAEFLHLPREQVIYEALRLGGGFGVKEAVYPEEVLVAVAARTLGRRVRWDESRSEHFVGSAHARQGRAAVKIALDRDGIVTALAVEGLSDIGAAYGFAGNSPGAAMGAMIRGAYRIPNLSAVTRSVVTNKTPLNVYRGAGHPQAVLAMERMMDRAARAFGLDGAEIRLRNLIANDAFPLDRGVSYPGAGRIVYDSGAYGRCLDSALDAIDAPGFAARRTIFEREDPGRRLGLGLAMLVELTSPGPDESVELAVSSDGRITLVTANVAMGQGAESALTQILSAAMGVDETQIDVRCGGSGLRVSGGGSYASRGTAVCGAAVANGAETIKRTAIALAADVLALPAGVLGWAEGGVVGIPGRNASLGLAELLERLPPGSQQKLAATGTFKVPASSFASACHAAVVSIDVETGVVAVVDYAVAHDCGTVLNPRGVDGQIIGGVMQGIGATLFEDLPYDDAGMPLVRTLMDYPLPVAANLPRFHLRHIETPSPLNPLGFKGAGEGGFTGAPAALVGAIEDALVDFGISLRDDGPYTPARVLGLIRDASPPSPQPLAESVRPCPS